MPKSRVQKEEALKKISEKISRSRSVYFAKYSKLTVAESGNLRSALRKEGSELVVSPKTITNLALKENKLDVIDAKTLEGQMAIVFGYEDEVTPAKILDKFRKENENKIEFLGGILDGKFYSSSEVAQLAVLPGKTELLAKLVGSINAPVSGFVNALAGNLRNFAYVLKAIEQAKS
jgi:large subunit ribosomal protein L10